MRSLVAILFALAAAVSALPAWAQGLSESSEDPLQVTALGEPLSSLTAPWVLEWPRGGSVDAELRDDDALCRLLADGDLAIRLPDPRFAAFWTAKRSAPADLPRWVLRDSRGQSVLEGRDRPSPSRILGALSAAGYRPRWERREAFLRENPEQGVAWLDAVLGGFRLAQYRVARLERQGRFLPSRIRHGQVVAPDQRVLTTLEAGAVADSCFAEMAEGLEGLLRVPNWALGQPDFLRRPWLKGSGIEASPRLRNLLSRLRADLLESWKREPEDGRAVLGKGWVLLGELLGEDARIPAELAPRPFRADPTPLRLVCYAEAPWRKAWESLKGIEALLPWTLDGLRWESGPKPPVALQERYGWGAEPRWVLLQGEEVLASGETCPEVPALVDKLMLAEPTRLHRLDAWILRQPEAVEAHRKRFALLLPHMPIRSLEWSLAEDARRAWIPLRFSPEAPWHPDADLWAKAALKVLPELEDALRRWPTRGESWKAYVSWSAFHPQHPSVLALANRLAVWGSHRRWLAGLPLEVHQAVADDWRSRGEFEAMRQWFQEARDGFGSFPANPSEREAWMKAVQPISEYLRAALVGLNRTAEVRHLDNLWLGFLHSTPSMRR